MRCSFSLFITLLFFQCTIQDKTKNPFDPSTLAGGSVVVLATLAFQNEIQITSRYLPSDYPSFIKTEILDLDFSEPVAAFFTKTNFSISENYKDDLVLRDVFPLSDSKLRVLFSVSSRSEWREPISLFIRRPESFGHYAFSGKQFEFKFPYPRYIGSISEPKGQITSTLLSDGRILLVGGVSISGNTVSTVEILNPETGLSTILPSLNQSLTGMAICTNPDGIVYVSGGKTVPGNITASSQISNRIYRIQSENQTVVELPVLLQKRRYGHTMVCLDDGNLLVSGGQFQVGNDFTAITNEHELISVQSGTSTTLNSSANFTMNTVFHFAEYVGSEHRVFFFGGRDRIDPFAVYSNAIRRLDLNSQVMDVVGDPLPTSRSNVTTISIPGGDQLVLGGVLGGTINVGSRSIESWNKTSGVSKTHGFTTRAKNGSSIVPYSGSQVLFTGGVDTYYKSGILELYDHTEMKNFVVDTMMNARSEHCAVKTNQGIVIFGDSALNDRRVELYGKD
ncbi:Kelch repeat-containing protein [Leptospira kanakyensis]|uniref:Kelch-like protein n=1 Tax=Leptospira kanakyensis TaxID=2484968 RepID=A0A6N4QPA6_9LEPT|nr:kelch repeat-containing protein [Leptospira kanakyensis]MCW7483153.1 kelch-like protein [Leptospira kanakyensis]TGK54388.1 kelch-like protein [Leptospira kanakyensis]TGK59144.1 kelch-like protein [Leptospira kanakyensis]TGK75294.1 kelch-like protein [Leptospira kanakyensis]